MTPATIAQAKATQRGCLEAGVAAEQAEQVLSQFVAHPAFEQAGAHLLRLQQVRSSQHMLTAAASCYAATPRDFGIAASCACRPALPACLPATYILRHVHTYALSTCCLQDVETAGQYKAMLQYPLHPSSLWQLQRMEPAGSLAGTSALVLRACAAALLALREDAAQDAALRLASEAAQPSIVQTSFLRHGNTAVSTASLRIQET